MNRGESPKIDLDRPSNGGHVSRDFPLREIGSRELGSSGEERSGHCMVETPKQIRVVRLKEATCREISHFGKSGIANSGVLVMRDQDFPLWKPRDRFGPSDLRRPVSRDYPFLEIRNHELRSFGDERLGLSIVETPR